MTDKPTLLEEIDHVLALAEEPLGSKVEIRRQAVETLRRAKERIEELTQQRRRLWKERDKALEKLCRERASAIREANDAS